jgi:hypothetical protein
MTSTHLKMTAMLLAALLAATGAAAGQNPEQADTLRTFYFGNSLTNQQRPDWHDDIARPRGDTWTAEMYGVAGGRLWQYVQNLFPAYPDMDTKPTEDKALKARNAIERGNWDVIVLQPHQMHREQYANWLGREAGDVHETNILVPWIRKHQPSARLYLYQTWAVPLPIDRNQENPDFANFDYESYWKRPYANPAPAGDPDPAHVMRTRDYHKKLLDTINQTHKEILGDQPARVIPVGDAMLEVQKRLKAGKLVNAQGRPFTLEIRTVLVDNETDKNLVDVRVEQVPFTDIEQFYMDFQHQKPGLPRFFDAAVFYSTLFGEAPSGLDFSNYNVYPDKDAQGRMVLESNYNWRAGDNRKFIEITPDLAEALGDVIWQTVRTHPDAGVVPEPGSAAILGIGALLAARPGGKTQR